MGKYDCIAICVATVSVTILLTVMCFVLPLHGSLTKLTEALSQPGISDRVEMDSVTVTGPDGTTVTVENLDIAVNSRLLDVFLGIVTFKSTR